MGNWLVGPVLYWDRGPIGNQQLKGEAPGGWPASSSPDWGGGPIWGGARGKGLQEVGQTALPPIRVGGPVRWDQLGWAVGG